MKARGENKEGKERRWCSPRQKFLGCLGQSGVPVCWWQVLASSSLVLPSVLESEKEKQVHPDLVDGYKG